MKQFFAFVKKEFYHILRDRRTMLILLGMPIVMIVLFGFAISTELNNARVAFFAPSNDYMAGRIIDRFDASRYFSVTKAVSDPARIDNLLKENKADLIIVFEERFAENLMHGGRSAIQLVMDGSNPNSAAMLTGYATNIIADCQRELLPPDAAAPYRIVPNIKMLYNPQMKSSFNFVPGIMGLIMMLICAMMTSISIVREKERGTMETLLVSPVRPLYIILAKAVPYMLLSVFNLTTVLLLSVLLLSVPVTGNLLWLAVISLVFIFTALAMGLLISSIAKTQVAAMLASGMVLLLPVVMLSGMIFPVENMPAILQWVSAILPARWYIAAVKKIMIEGLPIYYALKELLILCGMAVVLITASLKKFNYRLQ